MTLINIGLCKLVVEKFTQKSKSHKRLWATLAHHLTSNASECKRKMERKTHGRERERVKERKKWQLFSTF